MVFMKCLYAIRNNISLSKILNAGVGNLESGIWSRESGVGIQDSGFRIPIFEILIFEIHVAERILDSVERIPTFKIHDSHPQPGCFSNA
jgi:hypothetical protein